MRRGRQLHFGLDRGHDPSDMIHPGNIHKLIGRHTASVCHDMLIVVFFEHHVPGQVRAVFFAPCSDHTHETVGKQVSD